MIDTYFLTSDDIQFQPCGSEDISQRGGYQPTVSACSTILVISGIHNLSDNHHVGSDSILGTLHVSDGQEGKAKD